MSSWKPRALFKIDEVWPRAMRSFVLSIPLLLMSISAFAVQFNFSGFGDLALVLPPDGDRSWLNGGLGKLGYGEGDSDLQFAGAVGQGSLLITPEILVVAVARVAPQQSTFVDLLESYVRYRPVSITPWRWSVTAGAFYAPFSLENTEIGWEPYWTLTPSEINSWFGDELRTIGAQFTVDWRRDDGTLSLIGSAFGVNEPAGVLIADRGWAMDAHPTGLFEQLREPDATEIQFGKTPPQTTPIFEQFDNRAGWYAGVAWHDAKQWSIEAFRYDNEANPTAHQDGYFAWYTRFWDAGLSGHLGEFTILAQAVTGLTTITPTATVSSTTEYDSTYALLGWERDQWRIAGRVDIFHTDTNDTFGSSPALSENGRALTASASWLPNDWFRLTGEVISTTSRRGERSVLGIDPRQIDNQAQLLARFYLN